MSDFDLIADNMGLYLYVIYPQEKARYAIDLIAWDCTCTGYTIEQAKGKKEKRPPNNCKHLDETVFRIKQAQIKLGKSLVKEKID